MRTVRLVRYGGLGMGLLLFGQITGMAASYEFTTIDYPNALNTALVGINSSGQIVGVEWDASFPPQSSFIGASNGMLGSAFQYPGAYYTHSFGIDDAGDVIGNYIINTAQLFEQGGFFRAADGTFNAVPSLMAYTAISGTGNMAAGTDNGLRLDIDHAITTIVVPQNGNGGIYAAGIDNLGNVVYVFNDASSGSFFRDSSGNYQTIYVPGSVYTEVQGMNNQGEVVGFYYDGITSHGFLWTGGDNYTTIDFPGADFTVLSGINDSGTITGLYAFPESGNDHGFVATSTSIPEPTPARLLAIGLALLAGARRRASRH